MNHLRTVAVAAALSCLAGAPKAALFDRGAMVYDSTLGITWLKNWNVSGPMDWQTANSWAQGLDAYGYDDWRLPSALNRDGSGPCRGLNCSGSELGQMFYGSWGATAGSPYALGTNVANLSIFINITTLGGGGYWTETPESQGTGRHWAFGVGDGSQSTPIDSSGLFAVAVRFGDVSPVPEPHTPLLMLLGLGTFALVTWQHATRLRRSP